jgi:hypothetical protein
MEEILLLGRDSKYNTGMLPTKNLSNTIFNIQNSITQMMLNHKEHNCITKNLHVSPFRAETTKVTNELTKHVISSILTFLTTCMK